MSVFKKLKDVLFDIEEEDIPVITKEPEKKETVREIKREVKEVREESPIKEIKIPKEEIEEPVLKRRENFNFPVDDFDFDDMPKSRVRNSYEDDDFSYRKRREEPKAVQPRMDYSKFLKEEKKKDNKQFTPTPIISPVYGILDQNYTKDDVIVKNDVGLKSERLEEVRKKAYGIEDKPKKVVKKEVKEEVIEEDEFTEPLKTLEEILVENKDMSIEKAEKIEAKFEEEEMKKAKEPETKEDALENDLFNLIDSMYEDKEESEEE